MNLTWRKIKTYFRNSVYSVKKDLKNDIPNTKRAFKEMLSNFVSVDGKSLSWRFLTSNVLRFFAVIFMFIDHFGFILFPEVRFFGYPILRIIGRGAFPIFAFLIIIGTHFTRSRFKYAMRFLFLAFLIQSFFFIIFFTTGRNIGLGPFYLNVYFQLFFGAFTIYLFERDHLLGWVSFTIIGSMIFFVSLQNLRAFNSTLELDYGIYGYLLITIGYLVKRIIFNSRYSGEEKWLIFKVSFGVILLALSAFFVLVEMPNQIRQGSVQLYVFLALPLIIFYSERKILRIRYLKWIYIAAYPLSFVIPGAIAIF